MMQRVLFLLFFCCSLACAAQDTVLKLYRPYGDMVNQAVPVIKNTLDGRCFGQSQLILREDAWRCEANGVIYDPCFVKAGDNRTEALCPQSPWVGDSVQIRMAEPINNKQNEALDMSRAYPWAIELVNGEQCLAIDSSQMYERMPIRYRCANDNLLVGHLQRCKNVWTMLQKTPVGLVNVDLLKAWF